MLSILKYLMTELSICMVLCLYFVLNVNSSFIPVEEEPQWFCSTVDIYPKPPELENHLGEKIHKQTCVQCHSMYEYVIGPPLVNVFERRDSLWVLNAITDFEGLVEMGDSLAIELFENHNETKHPAYAFSDNELEALVDYIQLHDAWIY